MRAVIDLSGQRFARLLVVFVQRIGNRTLCYCICDCGKEVAVRQDALRKGSTRSCGCYNREVASKTGERNIKSAIAHNRKVGFFPVGHLLHGLSHIPEYDVWAAMKDRCVNPNNPKWKYYGGRGIKVYERWFHSFENFISDLDRRPAGMSIDRYPNNDGNYEPGNVRWATAKQQAHNRRPYPANRKSRKITNEIRSIPTPLAVCAA
jgi:hypothetical protein